MLKMFWTCGCEKFFLLFITGCPNITVPLNTTSIGPPSRCFQTGKQVLESLSFSEVSCSIQKSWNIYCKPNIFQRQFCGFCQVNMESNSMIFKKKNDEKSQLLLLVLSCPP